MCDASQLPPEPDEVEECQYQGTATQNKLQRNSLLPSNRSTRAAAEGYIFSQHHMKCSVLMAIATKQET